MSQSVHSDVLPVCAQTCRSPGGDLGAKRKKKKQKRKKEKPSSGGAKSDSASDSQEFKVRQRPLENCTDPFKTVVCPH